MEYDLMDSDKYTEWDTRLANILRALRRMHPDYGIKSFEIPSWVGPIIRFVRYSDNYCIMVKLTLRIFTFSEFSAIDFVEREFQTTIYHESQFTSCQSPS